MTSYEQGKKEVAAWIKHDMPSGSTCLDVGAGNGKWAELLGDWTVTDAVEVYEPYIYQYALQNKYRNVFCADIRDFTYDKYDIIIFGDVIEHLPVTDAQKVLEYATARCHMLLVAVPFQYKQDAVNGNEYERHIQDDLTPYVFEQRYPGFVMLYRPMDNYAYYVKEGDLKKHG